MSDERDDLQLDRLASDAASIYEDAFRWFRAQGAAGAPLLLRGLADRTLGSTGHWRILLLLRELALPSTQPAVLRALAQALAANDPVVLPGALEAVAAFDTEEAVSALISVLDCGNADFVNHAAVLLGQRLAAGGHAAPRAQAALAGLLARPEAAARESAVRGLHRAGTPAATDALRRQRQVETDPQVLELLESLR